MAYRGAGATCEASYYGRAEIDNQLEVYSRDYAQTEATRVECDRE